MGNDDFMYSLQEAPRDEFVSKLNASLKAKGNIPALQLGKHIASIILIIFLSVSLLLFTSSEIRALVVQTLGIDEWIALSDDDAQVYVSFDVPQYIPEGYSRYHEWRDPTGNQQEGEVVVSTFGNEMLIGRMIWENDDCYIRMTVREDRTASDIRDASMQRNEEYAERYDWIDVFDVADVRGVWRLETVPGQEFARMTIKWISLQNIHHRMETTEDCLSKEEFIEMAQSTQ